MKISRVVRVSLSLSFLLLLLLVSGLPISTNPVQTSLDVDSTSSQSMSFKIDQQTKDTSGLVKVLAWALDHAGNRGSGMWPEVVAAENPDVLLLGETFTLDNVEKFRNNLNNLMPTETPYEAVSFPGTSGTDGQAIFSRFPIIDSDAIYNFTLDDGTVHEINHPIMWAILDIHGVEVHFLVPHISCCDQAERRLIEQEGVANFIDSLGDVPVVYGGDFNSDYPGDPEIEYFQGSLGSESLEMLLNSSHPQAPQTINFTDSFRLLNPERKGWTLHNRGEYTQNDQFRGRLDYILVSQHLLKYLVNSSTVRDHPGSLTSSDHVPLYTMFNFKADEVDLRPPLAPQNVAVDVSENETTISWQPNTEVDLQSYQVYRNSTKIATVAAGISTYTDSTNYDLNEVYRYEVSAMDNSSNEGRYSLPHYADPDYGELREPSNLTITATPAPGGINLTFDVGDNGGLPISHYKYYFAGSQNSDEYLLKGNTTDTEVFVELSSVAIDIQKELFFKFVAVNVIGESSLSAPDSAIGEEPLETPEPTTDENDTFIPLWVIFSPVLLVVTRRILKHNS